MTEARVRTVMQKVAANLRAFVVARLVPLERAQQWASDLTYLQIEEALDYFELQINGRTFGLRYTVRADGSVQQDSPSGGIDVYGLQPGITVQLYAHLRAGVPQRIYDELRRRGWGFNGQRIEALESEHRSFSSDGYGLARVNLGTWP
jgi:hypothetical protein